MPKFDASSVSSLEYDFTSWGVNDRGVIPEPTRALVNACMRQVANAFKELGLTDDEDDNDNGDMSVERVTSTINKIDDEAVFEALADRITDTVAQLCQGKPSYESLAALPHRPFMAFFGWLMGEVMSPEVSKPDTRNIRNLRRGA